MLLDITAAHDFLRALLSLLSDFDAAEDDENLKFKTVSARLRNLRRY